MSIDETVGAAADAIRAMPEMAGIAVIEDRKGDVAARLQAAVAKTRFAVLVGWNGFRARSGSSKTIVGDTSLVVEVFERPAVNGNAPIHLLDAARAIALAVNLSQPPGQSPIVFEEITPVDEPVPGMVTASVTFKVGNSTL